MTQRERQDSCTEMSNHYIQRNCKRFIWAKPENSGADVWIQIYMLKRSRCHQNHEGVPMAGFWSIIPLVWMVCGFFFSGGRCWCTLSSSEPIWTTQRSLWSSNTEKWWMKSTDCTEKASHCTRTLMKTWYLSQPLLCLRYIIDVPVASLRF